MQQTKECNSFYLKQYHISQACMVKLRGNITMKQMQGIA